MQMNTDVVNDWSVAVILACEVVLKEFYGRVCVFSNVTDWLVLKIAINMF